MSDLSRFMKQNKIPKENGFYAPTKSLTDENGKPLLWEFRHITSKEHETIRNECTGEVIASKNGKTTRQRTDLLKYTTEVMLASIVEPNLYNGELMKSYNVNSAEELLFELVDDPAEFQDFSVWLNDFQGFGRSLQEDIDEAKN